MRMGSIAGRISRGCRWRFHYGQRGDQPVGASGTTQQLSAEGDGVETCDGTKDIDLGPLDPADGDAGIVPNANLKPGPGDHWRRIKCYFPPSPDLPTLDHNAPRHRPALRTF